MKNATIAPWIELVVILEYPQVSLVLDNAPLYKLTALDEGEDPLESPKIRDPWDSSKEYLGIDWIWPKWKSAISDDDLALKLESIATVSDDDRHGRDEAVRYRWFCAR